MAINTSFKKSLAKSPITLETDAPSTLRTPISLVRRSVLYVAKPNKPRQEIKMASPAKVPTMVPTCASAR